MRNILLFILTLATAGAFSQSATIAETGVASKPSIFKQKANDTCNYVQGSNAIENGRPSRFSGSTIVIASTDDFVVPAGHCWIVKGIKTYHLYGPNVTPDTNWTIFYEDSTSYPKTSQRILDYKTTNFDTMTVGSNFGYPLYEIHTTFPAADTFCAGGTSRRIWVASMMNTPGSSNATYWEFRTDKSFNGTGGKYGNPPSSGWTESGDSAFVYELIYEELVSLDPLTNDTVCNNGNPISLPAGSPSGGTYSGTAVSGSQFDPSVSGAGTFWAYYSYTNGQGCTSMDSVRIVVETCASVAENGTFGAVKAYPNPVDNILTVEMNHARELLSSGSVELYTIVGNKIEVPLTVNQNNFKVDMSGLAKGTYSLILRSGESSYALKIVK